MPENALSAALPFLEQLLDDLRKGQDRLERKVDAAAEDAKVALEKAVERIEASASERTRLFSDKMSKQDNAIDDLRSRVVELEQDKRIVKLGWRWFVGLLSLALSILTAIWIFLAKLPDVIKAYDGYKTEVVVVPQQGETGPIGPPGANGHNGLNGRNGLNAP